MSEDRVGKKLGQGSRSRVERVRDLVGEAHGLTEELLALDESEENSAVLPVFVRAGKRDLIIRQYPAEIRAEVRSEGIVRITGHAAVFNQRAEIYPGYWEEVRKGAFAKTVREADIRALFNHDVNFVLGRSKPQSDKPKTLDLWEDDAGLAVAIDAPETQTIRDLVLAPMERGDVDQMSFRFEPVKQERTALDRFNILRTLVEVRLADVSVVTFPAYESTDAEVVRALQELGLDLRAAMAPLARVREGLAYDPDSLRPLFASLRSLLDKVSPDFFEEPVAPTEPQPARSAEPVQEDHSDEAPPSTLGNQPSRRRRELELARARLA